MALILTTNQTGAVISAQSGSSPLVTGVPQGRAITDMPSVKSSFYCVSFSRVRADCVIDFGIGTFQVSLHIKKIKSFA